jgi:hypothetical protein
MAGEVAEDAVGIEERRFLRARFAVAHEFHGVLPLPLGQSCGENDGRIVEAGAFPVDCPFLGLGMRAW